MPTYYQHGKIYQIDGPGGSYVGSTCRHLGTRLYKHRWDAMVQEKTTKLYQAMRADGFMNYKIKLLERFPCRNKTELRIQEQTWFDRVGPTLNMRRAYGKAHKVYTARDWKWARKKKGQLK